MIKQDQRKLLWFTVMVCLSLRFFLFLPFHSTPALPTHHSCFPYRVLLTAGGGCKRDMKMWNLCHISTARRGKLLVFPYKMLQEWKKKKRRVRVKREYQQKQGDCSRTPSQLFFVAEPYLRLSPMVHACLDSLLQPSAACPKAAVGCSPAPSCRPGAAAPPAFPLALLPVLLRWWK